MKHRPLRMHGYYGEQRFRKVKHDRKRRMVRCERRAGKREVREVNDAG